ncbi:acid protease [Suhomyces tanzawaensis NRRL Y-17324]|uniref:candidapepsin n=1 Tax=Suhomyces tanzawaensis NRRL Y-17324 TaxID=984487 RepID=A0A1E4SPA1_9ASCO|nr:acid protease [Suhomyces tanzawaensis NRRL Y-17324]ODV81316.1 acid protease [Suhomyces tanzawaensis NRRL Y-17324]
MGYVPEPLENLVYYFQIQLELGSDKQNVSFQVDTGSADFWVPLKTADCVNCEFQSGTFDNATSSTYRTFGAPFSIKYGGNDSAIGEYASDQVTISSGQTINNMTFGAVNSTTRYLAMMGVSFDTEENGIYKNFPSILKYNELIDKTAYSLYLTDNQTQNGEILFGAIDHAKYKGSLETFLVANNRLAIDLDEIVDANGTSHKLNGLSVLLDSGTADIWLPQEMFLEIGNSITGARYDSNTNRFVVDSCSLPSDKSLMFKLGNTTIRVPHSELLLPDCTLGIESSVSLYGINILGVSFLKHSYSVFNLDDKTISIAPVIYTSNSDIRTIE